MSSQIESDANLSKSTTTQSTSTDTSAATSAATSATTSAPTSTPTSTAKAVTILSKIPPRTCFQGIVTVEIGTGNKTKTFHIHKYLLTFYSDYFRAAFNGSFTEAKDGKISLADERVDVFDRVNQFVYTRELSNRSSSKVSWEHLIRVWIFGDKYLMPCLQNKAMNALIRKNEKTKIIPTRQVKTIYDNTVSGSPLRKFVLDLAAYKVKDYEKFMQNVYTDKHWPYEALADLIKAMGAKEKEEVGVYKLPEANRRKCYYHVHKDGEQC